MRYLANQMSYDAEISLYYVRQDDLENNLVVQT